MYNGTMIEELMAAVERVEEHAQADEAHLPNWERDGASTHVYDNVVSIEYRVRA